MLFFTVRSFSTAQHFLLGGVIIFLPSILLFLTQCYYKDERICSCFKNIESMESVISGNAAANTGVELTAQRSDGPTKQPPTKRHRSGTHRANSSPFVRLQSAAGQLFAALCSRHNEYIVPGKLYPRGSAPEPAASGRPHC